MKIIALILATIVVVSAVMAESEAEPSLEIEFRVCNSTIVFQVLNRSKTPKFIVDPYYRGEIKGVSPLLRISAVKTDDLSGHKPLVPIINDFAPYSVVSAMEPIPARMIAIPAHGSTSFEVVWDRLLPPMSRLDWNTGYSVQFGVVLFFDQNLDLHRALRSKWFVVDRNGQLHADP